MKIDADEARAFAARREEIAREARQRVALQLSCGLDLARIAAARPSEQAELRARIAREVRRERLKGLSGHWSYDLNRHIALKQVLDRISSRGHQENGEEHIRSQRKTRRGPRPRRVQR